MTGNRNLSASTTCNYALIFAVPDPKLARAPHPPTSQEADQVHKTTLRAMLAGAALAGAGLCAVASAQASTLPTLTLALTKTSITVGGTTQSGAVNIISTG